MIAYDAPSYCVIKSGEIHSIFFTNAWKKKGKKRLEQEHSMSHWQALEH